MEQKTVRVLAAKQTKGEALFGTTDDRIIAGNHLLTGPTKRIQPNSQSYRRMSKCIFRSVAKLPQLWSVGWRNKGFCNHGSNLSKCAYDVYDKDEPKYIAETHTTLLPLANLTAHSNHPHTHTKKHPQHWSSKHHPQHTNTARNQQNDTATITSKAFGVHNSLKGHCEDRLMDAFTIGRILGNNPVVSQQFRKL